MPPTLVAGDGEKLTKPLAMARVLMEPIDTPVRKAGVFYLTNLCFKDSV